MNGVVQSGADRKPLANATVRLHHVSGGKSAEIASATTPESGSFSVSSFSTEEIDAASTGESFYYATAVLGDDGVEQAGGHSSLHDHAPEARPGGELIVDMHRRGHQLSLSPFLREEDAHLFVLDPCCLLFHGPDQAICRRQFKGRNQLVHDFQHVRFT